MTAEFLPGSSGLVVNSGTSGRARSRELVYGDPSENFIISPRVVIGPVMQLFVYPRKQGNGRIVQSKADG